MLSKNQIKQIKSLHLKKFRQQLGLFLVEGEKQVQELLDSDFEIEEVFVSDSALLGKFKSATLIAKADMERISMFVSASPVAALAKMPNQKGNIDFKGVNLVLDRIKDPGNLGTIVRIADWFNLNQVFISHESVDVFNPKTVQASMGSIFRKYPIEVDLNSLIKAFVSKKVSVFAADMNGENLNQIAAPKNALIVLGSESQGIDQNIYQFPVVKTTIKKLGNAESLNVSVAAGIIANHFSQ